MKDPLQLVLVEDRQADAELILHELDRAGFDPQWVRVETEDDYQAILSPTIDLILADYSLPQFNAMRALRLLQERGLDVPFIVVTGAYEERGVECMKEGAADCLVKDRLARLGPAVRQALSDRYLRQQKLRAEEALRESEERYRSLVECSPDAVFVSRNGKFVYMNAGMTRMMGAAHVDDLLGREVLDFVHPDYREIVRERIRLITEHQQTVPVLEEKVIRLDGGVVEVEVAAAPCSFHGARAILVVARDIAARKRAENALRQSEERFRAIIDNALDAVVTIDRSGVITGWTAQAETIFGWRQDEAIGQLLASTIIPPAYRDAHQKGLAKFLETGAGPLLNRRIEITALRRDGREFPVELSVTPIATGDSFSFSGFIRDITERKRGEEQLKESGAALASANESLHEANEELRRRNVELDEFTFVASHELQEPLRKTISFSALLAKDLGQDLPSPVAKDLDFITDAARRMQTLVQDLLSLSRTGRAAMKRERVPLNGCVDRALVALAVRVEETAAQINRDELPDVIGDPMLLTQLYQNLIGNALKFVPRGQRPQIQLTCEKLHDRCVLGVRDNGIGIKAEYREQIFAPFKRLHARGEYEGSGIGLTICRKAVERHGGKLWVESQPGEGSHFRFTLGQCPETKTWAPVTASAPSSSSRRMIPAIKN